MSGTTQPEVSTDQGPDDIIPRGAQVVVDIDDRKTIKRTAGESYRLHGMRVVQLEGVREPVPLHQIDRRIS